MGDKYLLKMAAKAAGHKLGADWNCLPEGILINGDDNFSGIEWNPLKDDGDALRLAAVIEMELSLGQCGGVVYKRRPMKEQIEELSEDYMSAIRLSIVRSAAEIGKANGK